MACLAPSHVNIWIHVYLSATPGNSIGDKSRNCWIIYSRIINYTSIPKKIFRRVGQHVCMAHRLFHILIIKIYKWYVKGKNDQIHMNLSVGFPSEPIKCIYHQKQNTKQHTNIIYYLYDKKCERMWKKNLIWNEMLRLNDKIPMLKHAEWV